jgi:DNA-binding MarR family transcriptional regulator
MMKIDEQAGRAFAKDFIRLVAKFNKLERRPYDFDTSELLYPTEIHAIEAIGNKKGETAAELVRIFGVTKGAVSQVLIKLEHKGYIHKELSAYSGKGKMLTLTEKGRVAFESHARFHAAMDGSLVEQLGGISSQQVEIFKRFLGKIEAHVDRYLAYGKK